MYVYMAVVYPANFQFFNAQYTLGYVCRNTSRENFTAIREIVQ